MGVLVAQLQRIMVRIIEEGAEKKLKDGGGEIGQVQYRKNLLFLVMLLVTAGLMGWLQRRELSQPPAQTPALPVLTATPVPGPLEPLDPTRAPVLKKVVKAQFETTRGPLVFEIYPEAAPRAAERFIQLIKAGFYDDTPLFRVEPGFIVQFGINSKMIAWKERSFQDEPSMFRLGAGTVGFAKAGPDTNSTQVFINYQDNSQLVEQGGFTAFARVSQGFETALQFKRVEEAGDQGALWKDTAGFLKTLPEKPDHILSARILR